MIFDNVILTEISTNSDLFSMKSRKYKNILNGLITVYKNQIKCNMIWIENWLLNFEWLNFNCVACAGNDA